MLTSAPSSIIRVRNLFANLFLPVLTATTLALYKSLENGFFSLLKDKL
jgi:hypothetical protein